MAEELGFKIKIDGLTGAVTQMGQLETEIGNVTDEINELTVAQKTNQALFKVGTKTR